MLAELVDHVVGVDPDRDRLTAVIIDATTKAQLGEASFATTPAGYARLVDWADAESAADARVWSIEGAGSYGAGLCTTLQAAGEWVVEFDHPESRSAKDGAKTDGLDAARAAREILGRTKLTEPRSRGPREAVRALLVARRGAQQARVAAINALKALLITAPVLLREQLRGQDLRSQPRSTGDRRPRHQPANTDQPDPWQHAPRQRRRGPADPATPQPGPTSALRRPTERSGLRPCTSAVTLARGETPGSSRMMTTGRHARRRSSTPSTSMGRTAEASWCRWTVTAISSKSGDGCVEPAIPASRPRVVRSYCG